MPRAFWRNKMAASPRDSARPPTEPLLLTRKTNVENDTPVKGILKKPMPMKYI